MARSPAEESILTAAAPPAVRALLLLVLALDGAAVLALIVLSAVDRPGPMPVLASVAAVSWWLAVAGITHALLRPDAARLALARWSVGVGLAINTAGSAAVLLSAPRSALAAALVLVGGGAVSAAYLLLLARAAGAR